MTVPSFSQLQTGRSTPVAQRPSRAGALQTLPNSITNALFRKMLRTHLEV